MCRHLAQDVPHELQVFKNQLISLVLQGILTIGSYSRSHCFPKSFTRGAGFQPARLFFTDIGRLEAYPTADVHVRYLHSLAADFATGNHTCRP
jgi:hypothetical protein